MDPEALLDLLDAWLPRLRAVAERDADLVVGSKWSRKQLLGHLLDSAQNNYQRFVRLRRGDLSGFPGYDQEAWVEAGAYRDAPWADLVELWRLFNLRLAAVIRGLPAEAAGHRWQDQDCDLAHLVQDYHRHLVHHLERLQV